jgi:SAM-dependent methyltransferase
MRRSRDYQEDLAYIHHIGFGQFAAKASPGLLQILKRAPITRGMLVDLGCGSGIWASRAQQAGFDVVGIDASPSMVQLAQRLAPRAEFHCGSLYDWKLPRCQVITAIGESLTYFTPGKPALALAPLFRRLAAALVPGGLLIFDLILTGTPALDKRSWQAGHDWAILTDTRELPSSRRLIRNMTTFRKIDGLYRRGHEIHHVRIFQRDQVARALRLAGFSFRTAPHYGKMKLYPRRLAFICRKAR